MGFLAPIVGREVVKEAAKFGARHAGAAVAKKIGDDPEQAREFFEKTGAKALELAESLPPEAKRAVRDAFAKAAASAAKHPQEVAEIATALIEYAGSAPRATGVLDKAKNWVRETGEMAGRTAEALVRVAKGSGHLYRTGDHVPMERATVDALIATDERTARLLDKVIPATMKLAEVLPPNAHPTKASDAIVLVVDEAAAKVAGDVKHSVTEGTHNVANAARKLEDKVANAIDTALPPDVQAQAKADFKQAMEQPTVRGKLEGLGQGLKHLGHGLGVAG